jgi:hypothetical protein
MRNTAVRTARLLGGGQIVLGSSLLTWPPSASQGRVDVFDVPAAVVRALGVRLLSQGLTEYACPSRRVMVGGAAVLSASIAAVSAAVAIYSARGMGGDR